MLLYHKAILCTSSSQCKVIARYMHSLHTTGMYITYWQVCKRHANRYVHYVCAIPDSNKTQVWSKLNDIYRVHTEHWKWFSMTFQDLHMRVFQEFPGPFMSIFHVFPGLFNRVDIEQVRFSYNTEYVTQFIITLNNRSKWVWQWTMIMYVKAENVHGQKCGNHLVYFP